jgi:hypothetical protein
LVKKKLPNVYGKILQFPRNPGYLRVIFAVTQGFYTFSTEFSTVLPPKMLITICKNSFTARINRQKSAQAKQRNQGADGGKSYG